MAIPTPISYWKLDESSGNASDSVGSNTLTNVGTATYSAGKINNGVNLNGSSQYFTFGTSPQTGAGSWSVNVWVKTSASGSNNEFMFWGSNSTDNGIDLYKNSSNKLQSNFYGGGGIATSTTSINTGSWVMCTVTYDGTNIRVYVNGVLENTGANRTGAISGSNRYVGADGGAGNFWNGSLDELGTWNVTLTANDINLLYNAGLGNQYPFTENLQTSLLAYYKTDESSGNASDSTTTGATATNNATVTYATGKINNGAVFNNTNYLSVSNAAVQNVSVGISDFTVSCWVKITSNGDGIIAFSDRDRGLRVNSTNFEFFMNNAGSPIISITSAMTTNTFYHLVIMRNGSTFTFYKNGTSVGTQTNSTSFEAAVGTFNIGSGPVALSRYMTGTVDETGVWLRALTATEVTQLYNSGAGLQYPFTSNNTSAFFNLM
jgi:hypothetical protein